jgi:uncharacterized membrane protein YbaN (DUF454 family)
MQSELKALLYGVFGVIGWFGLVGLIMDKLPSLPFFLTSAIGFFLVKLIDTYIEER